MSDWPDEEENDITQSMHEINIIFFLFEYKY